MSSFFQEQHASPILAIVYEDKIIASSSVSQCDGYDVNHVSNYLNIEILVQRV